MPYHMTQKSSSRYENNFFASQRRSISKGRRRAPQECPSDSRSIVNVWPPVFEESGSLYIFDSRSNMFYEPKSDFFYDPQSCYYYGNKQKAYFRHDKDCSPPFLQVASPTITLPAKTDSKAPKLPSIKIEIKTKEIKSVTKKGDDKASASSNHVLRKQMSFIDKWKNVQQLELKDLVERPAASCSEIKKSFDGKPVCLLCKRKFQTMEHLKRHEDFSDLHKQNALVAAAARGVKRSPSPPSNVEDRSAKRRRMLNDSAVCGTTIPTKLDWARPSLEASLDVSAELKKVQERLQQQQAASPAKSEPTTEAAEWAKFGLSAPPKESSLTPALRQLWDQTEKSSGRK